MGVTKGDTRSLDCGSHERAEPCGQVQVEDGDDGEMLAAPPESDFVRNRSR